MQYRPNTIILGSASYDKFIRNCIKVRMDGKDTALAFLMYDADNYGSTLGTYASANAINFNETVNYVITRREGINDADIHYFRNKLNKAPASLAELEVYFQNNPDNKWDMLDIDRSVYHMFNDGGEYNLKFVSPDGQFEGVYDSRTGNRIIDVDNMGTYNYVGPQQSGPQHGLYDVEPFYLFGNEEGHLSLPLRPKEWWDTVWAWHKERCLAKQQALNLREYWSLRLFGNVQN